PDLSPLSLHDALPIFDSTRFDRFGIVTTWIDGNAQRLYFDDLTYTCAQAAPRAAPPEPRSQVRDLLLKGEAALQERRFTEARRLDRKSTRLNSSHVKI